MNRINIKARYWWGFLVIGALAAFMMLAMPALTTQGADHLDGPTVALPGGVLGTGLTTPQGADPRLDITDVYAFRSPDKKKNTVLIMTVSPLAGVVVPTTFLPKASYEFVIDANGDAKEDQKIKIKFSKANNKGVQKVEVRGPGGIEGKGKTGKDIKLKNGGKLRADIYDDPFFFDLAAFLGPDLDFCSAPSDFFAGLSVMGIVLEVPSKSLGKKDDIGVWARTKLGKKQIDRMAMPLVNTLLIPNDEKNAFNMGQPKKDEKNFGIPADILTIDTSDPTGLPNGRQLEDDVVGFDCVDEKAGGYQTSFPYLNQ